MNHSLIGTQMFATNGYRDFDVFNFASHMNPGVKQPDGKAASSRRNLYAQSLLNLNLDNFNFQP